MPRFFTGEVDGRSAVITGEDARHIALSLRMKPGEPLTVCDSAGHDYQCVVEAVAPGRVDLRVEAVAPSAGEPGVEITLYQALPKGDKLEMIVQKAVELGVGRIVPVLTRRCVSRPDEKSMKKKLERLNRIAARGRQAVRPPPGAAVEPLVGFEEAVARMKESPLGIFFYENADESRKARSPADSAGRFRLWSAARAASSPPRRLSPPGTACSPFRSAAASCAARPRPLPPSPPSFMRRGIFETDAADTTRGNF